MVKKRKRYVGSWERHLNIRLRFWLSSGPAGLFKDKVWIGGGGEISQILCPAGVVYEICQHKISCTEFIPAQQ